MSASSKNASAPGPQPANDLSGPNQRLAIGILGLLFPLLLFLISGWRPTTGLAPWQRLDSISAYYYTSGAGSAFSGIMIALAVFFFTYRGYDNPYRWVDQVTAIVAGCAAVTIVLFPTTVPATIPPDLLPPPTWWSPPIDIVHHTAGLLLFLSFFVFCIFQFPRTDSAASAAKHPGAPWLPTALRTLLGVGLPAGKQWRNRIYVVCGLAIVGGLLWLGIATSRGAVIFWPETWCLFFFALSWLVKGRIDSAAMQVGHFATHPRELVDKVRGASHGEQPLWQRDRDRHGRQAGRQ